MITPKGKTKSLVLKKAPQQSRQKQALMNEKYWKAEDGGSLWIRARGHSGKRTGCLSDLDSRANGERNEPEP